MSQPPIGYRASGEYHTFLVGRSTRVELEAASREHGEPAFFDASAATWQLRLRFAPFPITRPTTFDRDYEMEKLVGIESEGDTARCFVDVNLPTEREQLHVEWVAVDLATLDATTPSGRAEKLLDLPWIARAIQSPGP